MIWLILVYLVPLTISMFWYVVAVRSKCNEASDFFLFGLIPGFNISAVLAGFGEYRNNSKFRAETQKIMRMRISTLDKTSSEEMEAVRLEYRKIVEDARTDFRQKKNVIKSKSKKRKLCKQLGLELGDLDRLKELPFKEA